MTLNARDPPIPLVESLDDLRASVARLERDHATRGVTLSGRIIHVSHYLPVVAALSAHDHSGVPTPPMTPDREPTTALDTLTELSPINGVTAAVAGLSLANVSSRWTLSHRRGHSAMHSGIRSLSATHEQVLIGWIGAIQLGPSPPLNSEVNTTPSDSLADSDKHLLDELVATYHGPDDAPDAKAVSYASVWLDDATAHDH
jgi:trehalose 6-phosphate synthase/phosphatase